MFTGITRSIGIARHSHVGTLVTAILVLSGAAILRGGAAAADSNQDDQFLALLDQEGIPALEGVPYLIDTAHKVCRAVDAGFSANAVVDAMVQFAYSQDPAERNFDPGRLARTEARFVTASVGAYCPYDRGKVANLVANPAAEWNVPTPPGAAHAHNAVNSAGVDLESLTASRTFTRRAQWQQSTEAALGSRIGAVPAGEVTQPNPPQLPAPPPQLQHQTTPEPVAAPPRPQRVTPPPQSPPHPRVVPQPGAAPGNGGGASTGGDLPAAPPPAPPEAPPPPPPPVAPPPPPEPPAPPMAPGFVRLAP